MFETARELAGLLGIEPERLRLEWISSAEGRKFAEVIREFTEHIRALGPAPGWAAVPLAMLVWWQDPGPLRRL